jgi:hypothetical protein
MSKFPWLAVASLNISLLFLVSCAPKVKVAQNFETSQSKTVAVLPAEYPAGVSPDRVNYIRSALISEIRNHGYIVLDDKIVDQVCSGPACPERSKLTSKFMVDAFFKINVDNVSRNNFTAGYYNAVSGNLQMLDRQGAEILKVEQTESEHGGLLFNSGQLFQGLISQAKNSGDGAFDQLADKFVSTLVSKIPAARGGEINADATAVSINSVEANMIQPAQYRICTQATPVSLAYFLYNNQRTNLREISPGRYCGVYRLDEALSGAKFAVEVRSPFGVADRKDLILDPGSLCDISGNVVLNSADSQNDLQITCTKLGNNGSVLGQCAKVRECSSLSRFYVYKAPSEIGPYQKVADIQQTQWQDRKPASNVNYQVVTISSHGTASVPVAAVKKNS